MREVSLSDVATALNISPMTVSRVVNNSGVVSKTTRRRVMSALARMGYRKDVFASANARKRASECQRRKTIVFDLPTEKIHPYFIQLALRTIQGLSGRNYERTIASRLGDRAQYESDLINADILVFCSIVTDADIRDAREINPRLKIVSVCSGELDCVTVNPDDRAGGELAARHLIERGHRRVAAFVHATNPSLRGRRDAFLRIFSALAPESQVDVITVKEGDDGERKNMEMSLNVYFAKTPAPPTAIFALNAFSTVFLYNYLKKNGVAVPAEIGILGYDEADLYGTLPVALSRVVFSMDALCAASVNAVTTIAERSEAELSYRTFVPVRLMEHHSIPNLSNET